MRATGLLALLLIGACSGEPDFEERFDNASQEIQAKADAIDAELQTSAKNEDIGGSNETPSAEPD